ncbi:DUF1919 domain-containing protein [Flavobacteriaceae bacterium F08102]|nr:DUF1919 domain-containing protein [Flavobacteriaceae bacterium F08102]
MRKLIVFIRRKVRYSLKNILNKKDISRLKDKEFVIISNNCWGGEVYQWFERPYNSPFVGLFLFGPCYLKLVANFDHYMNQPLQFIKKSKYPNNRKYPIGKLDDIEIQFSHYKTEEEARSKWNRRTERMKKVQDKSRYFFKICDRELCTIDHIEKFHQLPVKNKLSFSVKPLPTPRSNHIIMKESFKNEGKCVPNGVKTFKLTFIYFNITKWLLN